MAGSQVATLEGRGRGREGEPGGGGRVVSLHVG